MDSQVLDGSKVTKAEMKEMFQKTFKDILDSRDSHVFGFCNCYLCKSIRKEKRK